MSRTSLSKSFICLCLAFAIASGHLTVFANVRTDGGNNATGPGQIQFAAIIVNDRTLTGPNSAAHRRDGRILVPLSAIARSLGDVLSVNAADRIVAVRRQTGSNADFDAKVGQVRESGSPILTVSNASQITFSPNSDELLLPVEIAAALFDVSIRYDSARNAVVVARGQVIDRTGQTKTDRNVAEIHQVDYEYNLNSYASATWHNLNLTAAGRLADGRFSFLSNSNRSGSAGVSLQNVTFSLERPNGQLYTAGDFGTGGNLQFLSANVRGASVSVPVGDTMITAFGGRSFSGVILPVDEPLVPVRSRFKYDTNTFGAFATTNARNSGRDRSPFTFSAGAMHFSGSNRGGDLVTGSVNYEASRFRLQSDLGYGKFEGLQLGNLRRGGYAAAFDLAGTFQVRENLAIQGRYTNIGKNFLSPQNGIREPLDLKAFGVTWSPMKWLSTSFNASSSRRPGDILQNNKFATAAFAITPSAGAPRFYFAHTQSSTSQIRSSAFTMLNASKDFRRFHLYMNATRIKNIGPASVNAQFGATYAVSDTNSIEFSQGVGSRKSLNGQFDWRTANLLSNRLSFSAGVGYNYTPSSGFSPYERLSASVNLPRQTSLQVNYYQTDQGPTLLVTVRGSLFKKREARAFLDSPASEMNSYGKVSGRVYQDVDQNGKFDPSVDKPQADVKVRIDGNRYVVSDENGIYQFESINAGEHKIYLDLLSVRADLTMLGEAAQDTRLLAGHTSNFDFRLVRTGRITGRVWLDANENGKFDEGETPLADVRVVTASGRDTLTDADGSFTIGDLAPGEHVFLLDEKTLPEKTMAGFKPIAVQAFAGRETSDINLTVIAIPAEVKRFPSKTN